MSFFGLFGKADKVGKKPTPFTPEELNRLERIVQGLANGQPCPNEDADLWGRYLYQRCQ